MNEVYILKPNINILDGYRINGEEKEKELFKNETITQVLNDCTLTTTVNENGDNFTSYAKVEHKLEVGDVLIFTGEKDGYVYSKQLNVCKPSEAIEDLRVVSDIKVEA